MYLAEGEGMAMPCLSEKLLKVCWKWNGYDAMYYLIKHDDTCINPPLLQRPEVSLIAATPVRWNLHRQVRLLNRIELNSMDDWRTLPSNADNHSAM